MAEYEITTITSRGQVTIPQDFRDKEKMRDGDKILVRDVDGYIVMKKISEDMLKDFFNTMKEVGKHISASDIRDLRKESEDKHKKKTKNW